MAESLKAWAMIKFLSLLSLYLLYNPFLLKGSRTLGGNIYGQ